MNHQILNMFNRHMSLLLSILFLSTVSACKKAETVEEKGQLNMNVVSEGEKSDQPEKLDNRPNLLFIMTDQQRLDTLSCGGNTIIQTPNLDEIARNGVYFERCYTICPVCMPARSSILTGMSPSQTKITANNVPENAMRQLTFDEILINKNGYYGEYWGKWHSSVERANAYITGFNTVQTKGGAALAAFEKDFNAYLDRVYPNRELKEGEFLDKTYKRPYIPNPVDHHYGYTTAEVQKIRDNIKQPDAHGNLLIPSKYTRGSYFTDKTIEALDRAKAEGKAFTVTLSIGEPHSPMIVTDPYYGMYPTELFTPPTSISDPMTNSPYATSNGRKQNPEYSDPEKIKYMMSDYYAMIKQNDDNIGRVIQKLKDIGEYKNTMIIFTSDHGEMLGSHGMREKNVFYEESVRVPLLISFPGKIKSGTVVSDPVSNLDIFATILDYLDVQGDNPSNGKSLRGLIEGKETRNYVVSEWGNENMPTLMVATKDWKLMVATKKGVLNALYDLKNDPYEMNNLIGNNPDKEQYSSKVEELKAYLLEYMKEVNHPLYDVILGRDVIKDTFEIIKAYPKAALEQVPAIITAVDN